MSSEEVIELKNSKSKNHFLFYVVWEELHEKNLKKNCIAKCMEFVYKYEYM